MLYGNAARIRAAHRDARIKAVLEDAHRIMTEVATNDETVDRKTLKHRSNVALRHIDSAIMIIEGAH